MTTSFANKENTVVNSILNSAKAIADSVLHLYEGMLVGST